MPVILEIDKINKNSGIPEAKYWSDMKQLFGDYGTANDACGALGKYFLKRQEENTLFFVLKIMI